MTFSPTFEMYELSQRITDGDVLAVRDLWALMFDEPFDPTRPLTDISSDISEKIEAWSAANKEADKVEEPPAQPDPIEDVLRDWLTLVLKVVSAPRSSKK